MNKNDHIIQNIKDIIRLKNIQNKAVYTAVGMQASQFSKLLNGEIKEYYNYLPAIAKALGIGFIELVTPRAFTQINHGSINENGIGQVGNMNQSNNDMYERLLTKCNEKEYLLEKQIDDIKKELEHFKKKYDDLLEMYHQSKVEIALLRKKN